MKELQTILEAHFASEGRENSVLATVVDVRGSSYRLPGARMLIDGSGKSVGTISGGCLEADVLERAKKVLTTKVPTVITYDTTPHLKLYLKIVRARKFMKAKEAHLNFSLKRLIHLSYFCFSVRVTTRFRLLISPKIWAGACA